MPRLSPHDERYMLPYCWVLPAGPTEGREVYSKFFQPVVQHQPYIEDEPLQLYYCDGKQSLQLQHHLSHLGSVL